MIAGGFDIGGTKCAVTLAEVAGDEVTWLGKSSFPTLGTPEQVIAKMMESFDSLLEEHHVKQLELAGIGISCGGPLDSTRGLILSPPNLPGWDHIDIVAPLRERYGVPVHLQNDANACALAEWRFGAGRGSRNMIFLTFGTGMGAGLILDGKLYSGTNDMAGEAGHMRLAEEGSVGFGKAGSFEGFCSGGGIAKLAVRLATEALDRGEPPLFCPDAAALATISARTVAEAAHAGDKLALEIYELVGRRLGQGLALLIDVLNPDRVVIGSIFARQRELLEPPMQEELRREALSAAYAVCEILPAGLGEHVGDYAAISVALQN